MSDADEDDLYAAMDWVLERQEVIEKKLAARHLQNDGLALYDLTSSYFEGVSCPIAKLGYDRDGKKGKLQVNYGLLTNERGIPVSVSVFEGNSGDPKTLLPQIEKVGNYILVYPNRGFGPLRPRFTPSFSNTATRPWALEAQSGDLIDECRSKSAVRLGKAWGRHLDPQNAANSGALGNTG